MKLGYQMIRLVALVMLLGALLTMPACNTIEGIGQDVSAAGQSVADVASNANPSKK